MRWDPQIVPAVEQTSGKGFAESKCRGSKGFREIAKSSDRVPPTALASLRGHWPEYLMEAGEITLYMLLVCTFATLLFHPTSPFPNFIHPGVSRRAVMGVLVGAAVLGIIMTPWGKQSGGHFNPSMTLTFYRLGKLPFWDTLFYIAAQFAGAIGGVGIAAYLLRDAPKHPAVRYAVTAPGILGDVGAFAGEAAISFILMTGILVTSNREALVRYTPYLVGALYMTFITFESPLSGMSMNPARTFGSAFHAGYWQAFWIYLVAPTLGMLAAAEMFLRARGGVGPYCAKLHHHNGKRCIFRHGHQYENPLFAGEMKMNKWKIAVPALVIVLCAGWYAFRPERLVVNRRVDEAFPADPVSSTQAVESGTFYGVVHPTMGTATIYRLADGGRILRFTNFRTSNGPDVHVYLVAANDAKDSATVKQAEIIDLGTIKGNIGDQNYTLDQDLDLSKYRTVSIWCKRFAVNFGAAPLKADRPMLQN
jgi:aquaporin Z